MPGLPRSIIKKYGVTKKAWAVFRSGRHRRKASPSVYRDEGGRRISLPRRRRITRYRGKRRGWRIPSIASLAPVAVIAGMNTGAFGYPAIPQLLAGNYNEGLQDVAINTVQMLTGFDFLAKSFDPIKPAVFYGSIFIPKILRKVFGRARVGPINIL